MLKANMWHRGEADCSDWRHLARRCSPAHTGLMMIMQAERSRFSGPKSTVYLRQEAVGIHHYCHGCAPLHSYTVKTTAPWCWCKSTILKKWSPWCVIALEVARLQKTEYPWRMVETIPEESVRLYFPPSYVADWTRHWILVFRETQSAHRSPNKHSLFVM